MSLFNSEIKCQWHPTAVGCFRRGGFCVTSGLPCDSTGIDYEWRKTQCMPREVCVDVGKEFGAATNTFFKPPCVSVYRCGGCCNSEGHQCMNTSTGYLSKTVGVSARGPRPRPALPSRLFKLWAPYRTFVQFGVLGILFGGGVNFSLFCGLDDTISQSNWCSMYSHHGVKAKWRKE